MASARGNADQVCVLARASLCVYSAFSADFIKDVLADENASQAVFVLSSAFLP